MVHRVHSISHSLLRTSFDSMFVLAQLPVSFLSLGVPQPDSQLLRGRYVTGGG